MNKQLKTYLRANLRFAEWAQTDLVPTTLDEYFEIGGTEVTMHISVAGTFLGLGKVMDRDKAYEWLKSRPKYIQAQAKRGRLMNDMTGFYVSTIICMIRNFFLVNIYEDVALILACGILTG